MDAPQAPAAPDPAATAAAQAKANKDTAITQYELGATNQNNPQGTSTYRQIGKWDDGTPRFEQTTALTPGEQNVYDLGLQTRQNLGNIGVAQSGRIGALLNEPFKLDAARDAKLVDMQKGFLDPQWKEAEDSMRSRVIASGAAPGSEAYRRAERDFSTDRQRAYDQMYLDAYDKAERSALTERNQPFNEIAALLSGSQVSMPQFGNTPQPGVAPTDYIGAVNQNLAQQNVAFNAANQRNMGLMKGIFDLGGAGTKAVIAGGWGKS